MLNLEQNHISPTGTMDSPAQDSRWEARRTIGYSVFVAVDVAFLGYLLTLSPWWALVPVITFVVAWRIAYEHWPFFAPHG